MPSAELEQNRPHLNLAVCALAAWLSVVAAVDLLLSLLLIRANGFEGGSEYVAGLFASTLWIAGVLNAGFLAVCFAMWPLISAKVDRTPRWGRIVYFSSGLLALNVAWVLWNHLQMAHQLLSMRPFITTTGVVEIAGIGLTTLLLWFGGAGIAGTRGGAARFVVVGAGIAVAVTLMLLDAREAAWQRVYSHQEIAAAVGSSTDATSADTTTAASGPVIVIGVDGLSWSVVYPLIRNGKLPALAELLSRGSFGYLDDCFYRAAKGDSRSSRLPEVDTRRFGPIGIQSENRERRIRCVLWVGSFDSTPAQSGVVEHRVRIVQ
jgi:hypothetical protein